MELFPKPDDVRISNWEGSLREEQKAYAALDAYACYQLYQDLMRTVAKIRGFEMADLPLLILTKVINCPQVMDRESNLDIAKFGPQDMEIIGLFSSQPRSVAVSIPLPIDSTELPIDSISWTGTNPSSAFQALSQNHDTVISTSDLSAEQRSAGSCVCNRKRNRESLEFTSISIPSNHAGTVARKQKKRKTMNNKNKNWRLYQGFDMKRFWYTR